MRLSRRTSLVAVAILAIAAVAATVTVGSGTASPANPQPPGNIAVPTITGLQVGQTLTVSSGTWAGLAPMTFYYDWHRSAGSGWSVIPGAAAATYTLTEADIGHDLFVQVKAVNADGYQWASSSTTATVTGPTATSALPLPDGQTSVLIDNVILPDRLVVDSFTSAPASLKPSGSVTAKIVVHDALGHPVRGALVLVVGLPFGSIDSQTEVATGLDGSVSIPLKGTAQLAHTPGGAIALSIRARKPGESPLAGVTAQRLVKLDIGG
jgi:hypothetical protein